MTQLKYPIPANRSSVSTDATNKIVAQLNDLNPIIAEVNSQDLRIDALENTPSGSNSFVKLASASNIDMATLGITTLTFEDGITAANSAPVLLKITRVNDTDIYNSNSDTQTSNITLGASTIASINPFYGAVTMLSTTEKMITIASLSAPYDEDDVYINEVTTVAGAQFLVNIEVWGAKIS